ncbi:MAG: NAD(P)/FAD-dependent oxidoreductase [Acidimicrobiia bacterium]|jgi:cation diffusion facilitator CzcD-associated flavoprotein CzcO
MAGRRIGIIGAGAGGIASGVRLLEAGYDDFVILEKASGVGGTWFHNRYPGLQCDVPSHLYSFSFEPHWLWSRPYGNGPEIRAYMEHVVERYGLTPHVRFDTAVVAARWDDERSVWRLTTGAGEVLELDVVIAGLGMFNELNYPDIPGLDDFGGHTFHSARWDWDHDLTGETVAVIGSAASAVQFVPEIAKEVGQLHLYQRAANWVLPKIDTPYTEAELEHFRTHPEDVVALRRKIFDQIDPYLTFMNPEQLTARTEIGLEAIAVVEDPEVRRKLTPSVPYGCQRPLVSNYYFPTFNRPNVELVTEPIVGVTEAGVVTADGTERAVDTIVLATGFKTTQFLSAIEVTGTDGTELADAWSGGAHAYLGITTAGFPNLFMLYGPNTNNGSIIYMIEAQVEYAVRHLQWMDDQGVSRIDVKPEVEAEYNRRLDEDMARVGPWAAGNCHNYYRSASGRIVTQWPHSMSDYRRRTEAPDFDAFATA